MLLSRLSRMVAEKISSSSSSESMASTCMLRSRLLGELRPSSGSSMRWSLCWDFFFEKRGTYSNRMLEPSRPYHFAGLPQMWRIRYLRPITRWSVPDRSVSGLMTLRRRQNLKSPTALCVR